MLLTYFAIGFRTTAANFFFYLTVFALNVITAESVGLFLSCAVVDFNTAAAINTLYLFTAMVRQSNRAAYISIVIRQWLTTVGLDCGGCGRVVWQSSGRLARATTTTTHVLCVACFASPLAPPNASFVLRLPLV